MNATNSISMFKEGNRKGESTIHIRVLFYTPFLVIRCDVCSGPWPRNFYLMLTVHTAQHANTKFVYENRDVLLGWRGTLTQMALTHRLNRKMLTTKIAHAIPLTCPGNTDTGSIQCNEIYLKKNPWNALFKMHRARRIAHNLNSSVDKYVCKCLISIPQTD